MSTESISMEQHLTFVNKMLERVRGTDLEPIWERLHSYMTKINEYVWTCYTLSRTLQEMRRKKNNIVVSQSYIQIQQSRGRS